MRLATLALAGVIASGAFAASTVTADAGCRYASGPRTYTASAPSYSSLPKFSSAPGGSQSSAVDLYSGVAAMAVSFVSDEDSSGDSMRMRMLRAAVNALGLKAIFGEPAAD
ncbi:MAG: hypothetical protein AAF074_26005 [Pseudomonadota bacterium]